MNYSEFSSIPFEDTNLQKDYDETRYVMAINFNNIMAQPHEAFIRTFIMTIGEFTGLYKNLATCPAKYMIWIGKLLFLVFEMGVSILQFNLLIAMMARTYDTISKTKTEYKRQFARVILMLEVSLSPKARHAFLLSYSRPIGINKKFRCLVVSKKIDKNERNADDKMASQWEKESRQAEERRLFLKKRLKGIPESRPPTQAGHRPSIVI